MNLKIVEAGVVAGAALGDAEDQRHGVGGVGQGDRDGAGHVGPGGFAGDQYGVALADAIQEEFVAHGFAGIEVPDAVVEAEFDVLVVREGDFGKADEDGLAVGVGEVAGVANAQEVARAEGEIAQIVGDPESAEARMEPGRDGIGIKGVSPGMRARLKCLLGQNRSPRGRSEADGGEQNPGSKTVHGNHEKSMVFRGHGTSMVSERLTLLRDV